MRHFFIYLAIILYSTCNGYDIENHSQRLSQFRMKPHPEAQQNTIIKPLSSMNKISQTYDVLHLRKDNTIETLETYEDQYHDQDKGIDDDVFITDHSMPLLRNELTKYGNVQNGIAKLDQFMRYRQHKSHKPHVLHDYLLPFFGYYLPSTDEDIVPNEQCRNDVNLIYSPQTEDQIMRVALLIDSWGKNIDGAFGGNLNAFGSFDECIFLEMPRNTTPFEDKGSFKGKYCMVGTYFKNNSAIENETPNEHINVNLPITLMSNPFIDITRYASCIPSTCSTEDFINSLNDFMTDSNRAAYVNCQTEDGPQYDFSPGMIVMITLLTIFGFLILSAGILDIYIGYMKKEELRQGSLKYLLVFSFYTNLEKMFKIDTALNKEAITCFYGMRTMSMTWVLWGHMYLINLYCTGNMFYVAKYLNDSWMTQIITNAMPSVDTFFFMSGLLVAYGLFKEKERTGGINLIIFYVHRFIRLSVPIMFISGFMATFPQYLASGPNAMIADDVNQLQDACQKYWWRDALFVTNYFPSTEEVGACLPVCWYTAVDFQLYLVVPIILLPFIWDNLFTRDEKQKHIIGSVWMGVIVVVSVIVPGILTGIHKTPPSGVMGEGDTEAAAFMNDHIYFATWCRAQPYLVGLCLGMFLRKNGKTKIKLQKWQVAAGWLIATATALAVVFGMYRYNQMGDRQEYYWPSSIFYSSLQRISWALSLAWVTFACHFGYGGLVNSFLSHPSWQPTSRLTYCIFLLGIPIQEILYIYNQYYPYHFSHLSKVLETVGALFVAGVGAVLASLCTEAPVIGLEKLLLRGPATKKPKIDTIT